MIRRINSKLIATVLIAALLLVSTAGAVSADEVDLLSPNADDSILIDTNDANAPDNNNGHSDRYPDDHMADTDEEYADHVDNVVLISFDRQLNREEISNRLKDTGIESVIHDSVLFISDGFAKISVRRGFSFCLFSSVSISTCKGRLPSAGMEGQRPQNDSGQSLRSGARPLCSTKVCAADVILSLASSQSIHSSASENVGPEEIQSDRIVRPSKRALAKLCRSGAS